MSKNSSENNIYQNQPKIYTMTGVDVAIKFLRPGARWEVSNNKFTIWDDPRPCPTWEEVVDTVDKLKALEDSINTIYTEEQLKQLQEMNFINYY